MTGILFQELSREIESSYFLYNIKNKSKFDEIFTKTIIARIRTTCCIIVLYNFDRINCVAAGGEQHESTGGNRQENQWAL